MIVKLPQKWVPSVRRDRCQACGLCGAICPYGCLDLLDGAGAVVRAQACTSEEQCVSACPEGAIPHDVGTGGGRSFHRAMAR